MPKNSFSGQKDLSVVVALFRIAFGAVWLLDAIFKWQPAFLNHFSDYIMDAANGQPAWLAWWYNAWMPLVMNYPHQLAVAVAIAESLVALFLIVGAFRTRTYIAGAVLALLIWCFGEGFGGPYEAGATDIGASVIYVFVFVALFLLDKAVPVKWSVDSWLIPRLTARSPSKNRR